MCLTCVEILCAVQVPHGKLHALGLLRFGHDELAFLQTELEEYETERNSIRFVLDGISALTVNDPDYPDGLQKAVAALIQFGAWDDSGKVFGVTNPSSSAQHALLNPLQLLRDEGFVVCAYLRTP